MDTGSVNTVESVLGMCRDAGLDAAVLNPDAGLDAAVLNPDAPIPIAFVGGWVP